MGRRLNLQDELEALLGSDEVIYQPPQSVKLTYPCIIYKLDPGDTLRADNYGYHYVDKYTVTHIHRDPDDNKVKLFLESFTCCRFVRRFIHDNLYHDVYEIYY